ncbi:hypothetical protein J2S74_001396 [Evansella vedderi]|uniref:Uncharacterized protein n=1 Tax=Evansella vedderi TaxID=38282 RepID=A0ABT9ZS18_9BACI|nr:hypothetical protein [Evansella vedderi]
MHGDQESLHLLFPMFNQNMCPTPKNSNQVVIRYGLQAISEAVASF